MLLAPALPGAASTRVPQSPEVLAPGAPTSGRRPEIDALRGLMLVLMVCTHLPTRFALPLGQPFGLVSAAEGFVLLSAYMAAMVYTRRALADGLTAMRRAFFRRALVIYACQSALLVFLFTVVALIGLAKDEPAVENLIGFFLRAPWSASAAGLALLYRPPLLDILPIYVLFMLASPFVLDAALRRGWAVVVGASLALWFAAQFGLGAMVYDFADRAFGMPLPYAAMGSFDTLAWQFVWVLGLWLGAASVTPGPDPLPPLPRWLVGSAVAAALVGLVWRHAVGQSPFGADATLNLLFDKWQLGPLRLIDLLALLVVVVRFGPRWARRLPRLRVLETLGQASLSVFCAHLVLVLALLALLGAPSPRRPIWLDALVFAGSFVLLYAVALAVQAIAKRAARGGGVIRATARRSLAATAGSRQRSCADGPVRTAPTAAGRRCRASPSKHRRIRRPRASRRGSRSAGWLRRSGAAVPRDSGSA